MSCSHSPHSCHSSHLRHPGYASHLHYFVTCVTSVTTVILVAFLSPLILPSFFAFATPYSPLSPQNLSPLSLLLPFTMSCLVLCCIPCHIPNYIPCPMATAWLNIFVDILAQKKNLDLLTPIFGVFFSQAGPKMAPRGPKMASIAQDMTW